MGKLRKKFKNNFTQVPNFIIKDERLSYRAKGIYLHLISKPDDWTYYMQEIIKSAKDGRDSTRNGIKELEKYGYLIRVKSKNQYGQFSGWNYYIYDEPTDWIPVHRENRPSGNPSVEETSTINIKPTNTDFTNTDCIYETGGEFRDYIRKNFINKDLLATRINNSIKTYILSVDPQGKLYDKRGDTFNSKQSLVLWDMLFEKYKRHELTFQQFAYKPHAELKKF